MFESVIRLPPFRFPRVGDGAGRDRAQRERGPRRASCRGRGDVVIGEALDHAQFHGCALAVGQIGKRLVEAVEPRLVRFHGGTRLVEAVAHAETLAGP